MNLIEILQFLHEVEKLKQELRHSWLSNGKQESVAEHTWRVSLMAILMNSEVHYNIDICKALKMAIIHDINEAYVGDVPAFDLNYKNQVDNEQKNIEDLRKRFPHSFMQEIHELWNEFNEQKTNEAKFIKAIDKIEVRIQHNEADISTWNGIEYQRSLSAADKYCEFDIFLKEFNDLVKSESKKKISESTSSICL